MSDVASPPLPHTATGNGQTPSSCGDGSICRVEVAAEVQPLAWLAGRPEGELCFWADRDGREEIAAAGILTEVAGNTAFGAAVWMERIAAHLEAADEGVRFYGGTRFDPQAPAAPEWRTLGAYRFVVPRFEAVRRDGKTLLACNFRASERDGLAALLDDLQRPPATVAPREVQVRLRRDADAPDRAGWETLVRTALTAIERFDAGALVVALGLDAHESDPMRGFAITTEGFSNIGRHVGELGLPTVLVQEGGYLSDQLGPSLRAFLEGFMQRHGE